MPRPPKRTLTFTVTIEGHHNTWLGRRERNHLVNVFTNMANKYLRDHNISCRMVGVEAPSNEDIDEFQSTYSESAPDWNAIAQEEIAEREGREIFSNVIPFKDRKG